MKVKRVTALPTSDLICLLPKFLFLYSLSLSTFSQYISLSSSCISLLKLYLLLSQSFSQLSSSLTLSLSQSFFLFLLGITKGRKSIWIYRLKFKTFFDKLSFARRIDRLQKRVSIFISQTCHKTRQGEWRLYPKGKIGVLLFATNSIFCSNNKPHFVHHRPLHCRAYYPYQIPPFRSCSWCYKKIL